MQCCCDTPSKMEFVVEPAKLKASGLPKAMEMDMATEKNVLPEIAQQNKPEENQKEGENFDQNNQNATTVKPVCATTQGTGSEAKLANEKGPSPKEITVILRKDVTNSKLGLDIVPRTTQDGRVCLRVKQVKPGIVEIWNAMQTDDHMKIKEGDEIIDACGATADAKDMYQAIAINNPVNLIVNKPST